MHTGIYGFDVHGPPSLHTGVPYWLSILGILRKIFGAKVIVTAVPSTGSIASHAKQLDWFLHAKAPGRGINNASTSASENGGSPGEREVIESIFEVDMECTEGCEERGK